MRSLLLIPPTYHSSKPIFLNYLSLAEWTDECNLEVILYVFLPLGEANYGWTKGDRAVPIVSQLHFNGFRERGGG